MPVFQGKKKEWKKPSWTCFGKNLDVTADKTQKKLSVSVSLPKTAVEALLEWVVSRRKMGSVPLVVEYCVLYTVL